MTPNEIGNKRFDTPKRGYYACGDVDSYLGDVASYVAQLARENADLKRRMEVSAKKLADYEKDQEALSQALLNAQRLADSVIRDAQRKAEVTIQDAQIKAQQIRDKVKAAIVGEQQDFIGLRRQVADFRTQILELYKKQVQVVMETPDEEALGLKKPEKADASGKKTTEQPAKEPENGPAGTSEKPGAANPGGQPSDGGETAQPAQPVQPQDAPPAQPAGDDGRNSAPPAPSAEHEAAAARQPAVKQPETPSGHTGRSATIPTERSGGQAPAAPQPGAQRAAGEGIPAREPENDAPRLNLVYDEASGQYVPAGAPKPERFDDLKFGTDYHIGQDDAKRGGFFRKRK